METIIEKPVNYFSNFRQDMVKYVPKDAKFILEIGCGEGVLTQHLKTTMGAVCWGIEYEPKQAAIAAAKIDKVLVGDALVMIDELPDNYFDAVICNDVLEHLYDPYRVLQKLKAKIKPNGVMISSLPNVRYFRNLFDLFFQKNWDYKDSGILDVTHIRFFTTKSIVKMYENAGFEVIKHEGINKTKSIRPLLMNIFTFNAFWDIRFMQFATVAKVKK